MAAETTKTVACIRTAMGTKTESEHWTAAQAQHGNLRSSVMRSRRGSQSPIPIPQMRAVGYIRVSTDQQAQEGVSLDAQRVRLKAHCVSQGMTLVDLITDNGYSAKSLDRPGLQTALRMLTTGKANALVVVKLDRLTRSVKDLGHLCDTYFRDGMPYSLLSVSDAIDTRSAGGKLLLNVLMSVAQWEREAICERTQEAMDELKRQGVALGGAPYGWRYSDEPDSNGRRYWVEVPAEQRGIRRICELYETDMFIRDICGTLDREGISPRGPRWNHVALYRVLKRAGYEDPYRPRKSAPSKQERALAEQALIQRDKTVVALRAVELRAQGSEPVNHSATRCVRSLLKVLLGSGRLGPRG